MHLTFRWYGTQDPVKLEYIRQIPGMHGIVSAVYDIPVGEAWPLDSILELKKSIEDQGLELSVIESVPVHEDIKLRRGNYQTYIDNYKETLRNLGKAGIHTVCYNFMPIFDWTRTQLHYKMEDGSECLALFQEDIESLDPRTSSLKLPGWDESYTTEELNQLINDYASINKEVLWDNLSHFINEIIPVAEENMIKMAIHPDDPPWDIFGIPRIISTYDDLERFININDSMYHGITFCSGSLGCIAENDLLKIVKHFSSELKRVHFVHLRNIKVLDNRSFTETAHLSRAGSIDFYELVKELMDGGFDGPFRPDHGRMIWGESGRPGYGLYDRALGATYLNGLIEAISKQGGQ